MENDDDEKDLKKEVNYKYDDNDVVGDDEASPSKANAAGRHNIRPIISDNNLNR